ASFRRRAAAWLIDVALIAVATLIIELVEAVVRSDDSIQLHFEPGHSVKDAVFLVLYFGLLTYWGHGQTPGKRLFKIRVVSLTHSHLSLWHSVERALGYAASALEAGFGFWQYFVHPNRQTVHDRIAETIVIDERQGQ
ncbi:MAG TPA: RDD family protein, partial [Thermoanaerobaculia bacterium]|nr:RDD family protein [Thermoanaerobaculia bacterium]